MHISIQRGKLLPPTEFNKFVLFKSVSLNLLYSIESSFKTCIGSRSCNTPSLTSLRLTPKALQAFSYFVRPSASIFSSSPYLYIETLLSIHFQLYTYINFNIFVFLYIIESLILSYERRLFLHLHHYVLRATDFHNQLLVVYSLLAIVVEGKHHQFFPARTPIVILILRI